MGWMIGHFALTEPGPDNAPMLSGPSREKVTPPRGQQEPASDALLLHLYLTGYLFDEHARGIVSQVLNINCISDPIRRVQAIKREIGASRRRGPPPGRTKDAVEPQSEIYELLQRQVLYMLS